MFPPKKKTKPTTATTKFASMNAGRFSGYDKKKEPSVPKVKTQTRREANQANKQLNKELGIQSPRQVRQESRQKNRADRRESREIQKANAPKKQRGVDLSVFNKGGSGKPTSYKAPKIKHSRSCKNVMRMGK
jgi:hypothetical protein